MSCPPYRVLGSAVFGGGKLLDIKKMMADRGTGPSAVYARPAYVHTLSAARGLIS
jgi:hypothetical protein